MIALREVLTPQQRYTRAVDDLLARHDRLTDRDVRQMVGAMDDARRIIIADLAEIGSRGGQNTYRVEQLGALHSSVDRLASTMTGHLRPIVGGAVSAAWDRGAAFLPDALGRAGVTIGIMPEVSREQLAAIQLVTGDLLGDVSRTLRSRARAALTRGVLGVQSPFAVMQSISALLTPGKPGSVTQAAETLVRTETMGAFNLANRIRMEETARGTPGLQKYWLATRDKRTRPDHVEAGQKYTPGGDPGPILTTADFVVGGEKCWGPHDPRLSADQRVRCRCVAIPVLPKEWESL